MKKAAIYVRVSTLNQVEEGHSIEAQIEKGQNFCKARGFELYDIYADKGISGKSLENRFEIQRLLRDVDSQKIDVVIVWKISRLGRNQLEVHTLIKGFGDKGVDVISISEGIDTTNGTGKLLVGILASVAEFERETIIENVKLGMEERARKGLKNGGKLLGYRTVGVGKEARLEVVESEAEIVKLIFQRYTEGRGYRAIASELNEMGLRTKRGNYFNVCGVSTILDNITYIGKIRFNNYVDYSNKFRKGKNNNPIIVDGQHEAIITKEIWDKVVRMRRSKKQFDRTNRGKYPLTGVMKCPVCGSGMVAAQNVNKLKDGTIRKLRYYVCGRFHNMGSKVCSSNSIRADSAEAIVFSKLSNFLNDCDLIGDVIDNLNARQKSNLDPFKEKLKEQRELLCNLDGKRTKGFEAYEEGLITKDVFKKRMSQLSEEQAIASQNIKDLESKISAISYVDIPKDEVVSLLSDFNELFSLADPVDKKALVRLLVSEIELEIVGKKRHVKSIKLRMDSSLSELIEGELPIGSSPLLTDFEFVYTI